MKQSLFPIQFGFFWMLIAIVFIILGVRLTLIFHYGNPLPFWDQWDAQAGSLFPKWLNGQLSWQDLIIGHSEHRIVFSRLLSLALFAFNESQWDPLLEMGVNALLAVGNFLLLMFILVRLLGWQQSPFIVLFIGILWILPYANENILSGFHSMWFLLVFFSLLAFWGVLLHRPQQWQWWVGMISGFFAYFNLASGLLTPLALVFVGIYGLLMDKNGKSRYLWQIVLAILSTSACIVLMILNYHHNLGLSSPSTTLELFLGSLIKALSFPWDAFSFSLWQGILLSLFLQLPTFILALRPVWKRQPPSLAALFVITLAIWTLLQAAAIAYARPSLEVVPSRYTDILVFNLIANWLAFYLLLADGRTQSLWLRKTVLLYAGLWTCLVVGGLLGLSYAKLNRTDANQLLIQAQIQNVKAYIQSGNPEFLQNKPFMHIPYPAPELLAVKLENHQIQKFLPSFMTLPEQLPTQYNDGSFVLNGFFNSVAHYPYEKALGSYTQIGNLAQGRLLSQPLEVRQPYVELPVVGYWFADGMALQLVDTESNTVLKVNDFCEKPARRAAEVWMSCIIPVPSVPFKFYLMAVDIRPDLWFGFAMPRGIGSLSYFNQRVLSVSHLLLIAGLVMLIVLVPLSSLWSVFRGNAALEFRGHQR